MGQRRRDEALQAGHGEVLPERRADGRPQPLRRRGRAGVRPAALQGREEPHAGVADEGLPELEPGRTRSSCPETGRGRAATTSGRSSAAGSAKFTQRRVPARVEAEVRHGDRRRSRSSWVEDCEGGASPPSSGAGVAAGTAAQYCSIVVCRVERWTRSLGRDVDRADDPVGPPRRDVEHVEAARRLLEAAEEHPLARQRVREDRPVDGAVSDDERRVPAVVGDEAIERGEDAVEELADRLAAEEALLVRDDAAERVDERLLALVERDRGELRRPSSREARARSRPRGRVRRARPSRSCAEVPRRSRGRAGRRRVARAVAFACSRPSAVSGTSSRRTGRPSSSKYATAPWRMR